MSIDDLKINILFMKWFEHYVFYLKMIMRLMDLMVFHIDMSDNEMYMVANKF